MSKRISSMLSEIRIDDSIIQVLMEHVENKNTKGRTIFNYKSKMVLKTDINKSIGEFKLSGVGKQYYYEHQPEDTISINENWRGKGLTKPLIYFCLKYIQDIHRDFNILEMNPWIYIDADGSGTLDEEHGETFWDRLGFKENPCYDEDDDECKSNSKPRSRSRSRSKNRSRSKSNDVNNPPFDAHGYGYEKRVKFDILFRYGKNNKFTKKSNTNTKNITIHNHKKKRKRTNKKKTNTMTDSTMRLTRSKRKSTNNKHYGINTRSGTKTRTRTRTKHKKKRT